MLLNLHKNQWLEGLAAAVEDACSRKEPSMTSISRRHVPSSTTLLLRILDRPEPVAAVRELPGAVLGKLIDRIGLEDAGELVRPERFALWLRVMLEAGEGKTHTHEG
jgi:hypothetical protein